MVNKTLIRPAISGGGDVGGPGGGGRLTSHESFCEIMVQSSGRIRGIAPLAGYQIPILILADSQLSA